ncbi:hypothetical protein WA158_007653 [Blastocystis sp. Blastoise]
MQFNFDEEEPLNDPLLADDNSQDNNFIHGINKNLGTPLMDVIASPLPDESIESVYQNAALFCKDALHGRDIIRIISKHTKRIHSIYHNQIYIYFYIFVTILMMLMPFLERSSTFFFDRAEGIINDYIASGVEFILLAFITLDVHMQYTIESEGAINIKKIDKTILISIIICGLHWINLLLRFAYPRIPHLIRCLRPWYFIRRRRNVRNIGAGIIKTIPQVFNIYILLFIHLIFFSIFGKMLLAGINDDNCVVSQVTNQTRWACSVYDPRSCSDYFATFGSSMINLWTLYTTANYPDVMMPAYNCSPFYAIFFILFISTGVHFMLNFLLGYVYSYYQKQNQSNLLKVYDRIVCGLDAAFFTLCKSKETGENDGADDDDTKNQIITRYDFERLMFYFRPDLDREYVSLIYDAGVGGVNDKQMDRVQFRLVMYNYGRLAISKKPNYVLNSEKHKFDYWGIPKYCRIIIENKYVQMFNNIMLIVNFILVLIQMCIEIDIVVTYAGIILNYIFFVFLIEYIIKITGYGFLGYWRQSMDAKIETCVTCASSIGLLIATIADPKDITIARTIIILRLIRLVNIFKMNKQYQVFVRAVKEIINPLLRYLLVIICVYYFYAIWGMEFFSNILLPSNPDVAASSYGFFNYYNNNFNNLFRSYVTLFEQMVVNNWPIVMEGSVAATGTWCSRLFFIAFYVTLVMIVLNVVTSFTLEVFNVVVGLENGKGKLDARGLKAQKIVSLAKERGISLDEFNVKVHRWSMELYTQIFQDALNKDIRQLEFGWHGDRETNVK